MKRRFELENNYLKPFKTFVQDVDANGKHSLYGKLVTNSNNVYNCKIKIPSTFPYSPPSSLMS